MRARRRLGRARPEAPASRRAGGHPAVSVASAPRGWTSRARRSPGTARTGRSRPGRRCPAATRRGPRRPARSAVARIPAWPGQVAAPCERHARSPARRRPTRRPTLRRPAVRRRPARPSCGRRASGGRFRCWTARSDRSASRRRAGAGSCRARRAVAEAPRGCDRCSHRPIVQPRDSLDTSAGWFHLGTGPFGTTIALPR